jgi:glycosyltransferase involved in cell wall biosynthesis
MRNQKSKILLINFEEGGVGSSGFRVADALSRNPHLEVHCLYTTRAAASPLQAERLKKIPGMAVRMQPLAHRLWSYLRILFYCLKLRPDIIHDLGGSSNRKNMPLWPFFAAISRFVMTEPAPSDYQGRHVSHRITGKLAYLLAKRFVVFGPKSYQDFLETGMAPERIFLSRLGHKDFYSDALAEPPLRDPNSILFFGELRPGKGLEMLVAIAEAVRRHRPKVRFVVAGSSHVSRYASSEWRQRLENILKEMRACSHFEVRDEYIPDEEVAGYFWRAGMVILPYADANQSGVLMTAMALDCPVIAAPVGDLPTALRHEENGLLCPARVECFAGAIISLMENPRRARELAARAKQDVYEKFSWEKLVEDYPEKLYQLPQKVRH